MTAITNPLVNSYKRLVPGYEAPVYMAWSATNRSPLIRIPAAGGEGTRIELRSPDPSANPYLALAVCLRAGLDGIDELPGTLDEAVRELEKDSFICQVLGSHVSEHYIAAKKKEWQEYRTQVTAWEVEQYLYRF